MEYLKKNAKKMMILILILVSTGALLIAFQNCGKKVAPKKNQMGPQSQEQLQQQQQQLQQQQQSGQSGTVIGPFTIDLPEHITLDSTLEDVILVAAPNLQYMSIDLNDPSTYPRNIDTIKSVFTQDDWNFLFPVAHPNYTYEGLLRAAALFPHFCGETSQNEDLATTCRREIASMVSHFAQETGMHAAQNPVPEWRQGLYYMRELGCSENGGGCEYCSANGDFAVIYPCISGKKYYGRGAKQLSYNYNYGPFSEVLYGDKNILLNDPDRVASDPKAALASAFWFYMTPQPPKPSMHDVIVDRWIPNQSDLSGNREKGLGVLIMIINGGIECGGSVEVAQAQNRINYYNEFTNYFGIDPGPNESCTNMNQFDANSSAAINIYWERDWAMAGACKLVNYQTPFSLLQPNGYTRCVNYFFPGEGNTGSGSTSQTYSCVPNASYAPYSGYDTYCGAYITQSGCETQNTYCIWNP